MTIRIYILTFSKPIITDYEKNICFYINGYWCYYSQC